MTIAVRIPVTLRDYSQVAGDISLSANTVAAALDELQQQYPALYRSVCDETGAIRKHINLFVNSELVAKQDCRALQVVVNSGDVLTIWTAVSGG